MTDCESEALKELRDIAIEVIRDAWVSMVRESDPSVESALLFS